MSLCRLCIVTLAFSSILQSEAVVLPSQPGEATAVTADDLDPAAFAEWCDGAERPIRTGNQRSDTPQWVLWTRKGKPGHSPLSYGRSSRPGPRHLRIGFQRPIAAGSVLVRGGGSLSVLAASAPYPGDLNQPAHWIAASRLDAGQPGATEVDGDQYALWVLPSGTKTRALRFTHTAKVTDVDYAGTLNGAIVLPERFTDEAWRAQADAGSGTRDLAKLNNGLHDDWKTWGNKDKGKSLDSDPVVSAEHPEWISLTWQKPVALDGLIALWAGIGNAEVQAHVGPSTTHPAEAPASAWETVACYENIRHGYPARMWPNFLDFERPINTRAIRLRITDPGKGASHATNHDGRRIWLGELLAVRQLGADALEAVSPPVAGAIPHPPVAIPFRLEKPGFVTLVIERPDGFRIRNLISATWFAAGDHNAWWDGTDDLGRDADAAKHGVYKIPVHFAEPGRYRVRGLVRPKIGKHYEFSVYTSGDPPWSTEDHTGAWIANHSPPQATAFVPAAQSPTGEPVVYLGSYVTEGPDGLAWVDLDGKKLGGKKWLGGHWTAAPYLAADSGSSPLEGVHVYAASAWETQKGSKQGELRITALTQQGDKQVIKHPLGALAEGKGAGQVGGLAAHNGLVVVSLTEKNRLLFVQGGSGGIVGELPVDAPRGIAIEPETGSLLVLSGPRLLRYPPMQDPALPPEPRALVATGLDDPHGLTIDAKGRIYISDHGKSHQVKVFSPDGSFLRTIGRPGTPAAGPYDPQHMNHPLGIAVDSKQRIWVAEHDFLPKRVSVWSQEGKLENAYYGPGKYGGGGALDPLDKTKFYYAEEQRGALEFQLDWQQGSWKLVNILDRPADAAMPLPFRSAAPEQALYRDGRRYFTNAYNSNPTGGRRTAVLFADRDGVAKPAAAMGSASQWDLLKAEPFRDRWPAGVDLGNKGEAFFIWSDADNDARAQPEEVAFHAARSGGVTVLQDLTFCIARFDGECLALPPTGFSDAGVPRYEFSSSKVLARGVQGPASSGGDQALALDDGRAIVTLGIGPFDRLSICGATNGDAKWSYPSLWPGLHASHSAPRPDRPGQLIGTTRLPGGFFELAGSDTGPMWALHGNHGSMAIFTADGLLVANLFADMRNGTKWRMPVAMRNMDLDGLSLGEENFWPSLTHASEGKVYLVDGARSAIIRLDGMDQIRRLPDRDLDFTKADLADCQSWQMTAEAARQESQGGGSLNVGFGTQIEVDGKLTDWADADWVDIDKSGVAAYFNAKTKPYNVTAALAVSGGRLHAAWRTEDPNLLKNSAEMPVAPFKTGGALDLMLGPNGQRREPVPGDLRLLVTLRNKQPFALLYRAVVPGTPDSQKVPFSSPWRTITLDEVRDVSSAVEFAADGGNYEISIPLTTLGFKPRTGATIRGDIGILRGNGTETTARVYWHNKATGITADVPSEAMLTPALWGRIRFR